MVLSSDKTYKPMSNTHSLDLEASSSQYATAADSSSLSLSGDHTVECWVRMESLPTTEYMFLVAKHGASGQFGYLWGIWNNSGNYQVRGGISSNGINFQQHSVNLGTFNTGTWYHLAIAFTASTHTLEVYKDGVSLGTDATGTLTSIYDNTQLFYVGAVNQLAPAQFFDGLIDEVKIYSDVRTGSEILNDMYSSPSTGDNLVAYWSLNNVATDASGNSNTLTLQNSPSYSTTTPFTSYGRATASFIFSML